MGRAVVFRDESFVVEDEEKVRRELREFLSKVWVRIVVLAVLGVVWFPLAFFVFLFFIWFEYEKVRRRYFSPRGKLEYYRKVMTPKPALEQYWTVGYRVYLSELDEHIRNLRLLSASDPSIRKKGIDYLKWMERKAKTVEKYRLVGFNKDQLVTHFWVIGTTGAGKTSLLMKMFQEHMRQGGGLIYVDGKADEKMFAKLYALAQKAGREKDVYLINFLNTDHFREHTNTINPLANLNAAGVVEFLSSLLGTADGDMAYWQERGKSLLKPIVYFLTFRKLFYNEPYSVENIISSFEIKETVFMLAVAKGMLLSLEDRLKSSADASAFYNTARSRGFIPGVKFERVEVFKSYFRQYPDQKDLFERATGISTAYIENLVETYDLLYTYLVSISGKLAQAGHEIGQALYEILGEQIEKLSIRELKRYYTEIMSKSGTLEEALGDDKALIQHQYAIQQWTGVLTTLQMYIHIFGSLYPEVDMVDIIRNNKILYVLLPPLKQSEKTTEILGKMILLAIRQSVATALGGPVELTPTQKDIVKEKITPKPLALVVLDEYGSYPLPGIDTLLAQVRSINVSFMLSTQDYTSARVGGRDENSVRRVWANTQKIILRVKDNETLEAIDRYIREVRFLRKGVVDVSEISGTVLEEKSGNFEKEKIFDVRKLVDFLYGLALVMTDEEPIVCQIEYADEKPSDKVRLTHLEPA